MIHRRGREQPRRVAQKAKTTRKKIIIQIQKRTKIPTRTAKRPLQATDAVRVCHLRPGVLILHGLDGLDAVFRLQGEVTSCHLEGAFPEVHLCPLLEVLLQSKPSLHSK